MALIPPFFLDSVVAIGFSDESGKPRYAATGFIYGHFLQQAEEQKKTYRVYLVTNRHVVAGQQKAYVRFNPESGEPARQYELDLADADGKPRWLAHADPDVDIAVISFNAQLLRDHDPLRVVPERPAHGVEATGR